YARGDRRSRREGGDGRAGPNVRPNGRQRTSCIQNSERGHRADQPQQHQAAEHLPGGQPQAAALRQERSSAPVALGASRRVLPPTPRTNSDPFIVRPRHGRPIVVKLRLKPSSPEKGTASPRAASLLAQAPPLA